MRCLKMWSIINYLRDPRLVVGVQRFYGINSAKPTKKNYTNSSKRDTNNTLENSELRPDVHERFNFKENGYVQSIEKHLEEDCGSNSYYNDEEKDYDFIITNWFWYYLFVFGTEVGDKIFYATFIPFWFWNVDGAVGRRVVMVWTIIMYIGQGIKDIVCWPRPSSPPVHRLQKKWVQEYGMPSTHAMVGISIPFSVVLYTMDRYQYPLHWGLCIAVLWCSVMCLSRIYLGMHSVLDIIAGLVLALILMVFLVPLIDSLDRIILTGQWSPFVLIMASCCLIAVYPEKKDFWTPTKSERKMKTLEESIVEFTHESDEEMKLNCKIIEA